MNIKTKRRKREFRGTCGSRYYIPGYGWEGELDSLKGVLLVNESTVQESFPSVRPSTNYVNHSKVDVSRFKGGIVTGTQYYTYFTNQVACSGIWGFQYQTGINLTLDTGIPPVDDGALADVAEQLNGNLSGKMKPAMQALVTLIELGDIKSLPKQIKDLTTKFSKTLSGLVKQGAQADLVYKFALAPIVADAKAIINVIDDVQLRLNELALKSGKPNTFSARSRSNIASEVIGSNDYGPYYSYEIIAETETIWVAGLDAVVDYFISDQFASTLMAQRLMIDNVLGSAWELAKLSFVIDWFVNVGGMINSLNNKILSALGQDPSQHYKLGLISDSWLTSKTTQKVKVRARNSLNYCFPTGFTSFGEVIKTHYVRQKVPPSQLINYAGYPSIWGPGFNTSRAITGGELIVVKLFK